ncbi:MAG: hypothetical protein ACK40M_12885 [Flavobacteriales bacterium]
MKRAYLLSGTFLYLLLYFNKHIFQFDFPLRYQLSNVLAVPLITGWIVWSMQKFWSVRFVPERGMVWMTFVVISIYFELILPQWSASATGDPLDVLAYFFGTTLWFFLNEKEEHENDNTKALSPIDQKLNRI